MLALWGDAHYCARAPQARYFDYDHVKKQMYKVHAPHRESGYIAEAELREAKGGDVQPDWEMLYTPGRKARAEFRSFKKSSRFASAAGDGGEAGGRSQLMWPAAEHQPTVPELPDEHEALVAQLVKHKVAEKKARALVREKPEAVRLRLRAITFLPEGQGRKNFAGRLVTAIEDGYDLPRAFVELLEKERREKGDKERASKAKACPYCRELDGWRYLKGYDGPVRRCTHDPSKEKKYPLN
jgi:hypothetical protein